MSDAPSPAVAPEPPSQPPPGRRAAMRFIMIAVLIDMVSIGLIIPVLPLLVGTFVPDPNQHAYWYGVVAFAFGIANFFGAPILGALSDHFGRRPVMLIGFAGLALSFFGNALAGSLAVLIGIRLVAGALQANASVANAYVADISTPEQRAARFGMLGAMFGLGFVLGPVMGGLLGAHDLRLPFFVAGGLAICNWLYGFFVLPESLPPARRVPFDPGKANPFTALRHLTGLGQVGSLVAVIALAALAQFMLQTTWVLYTRFKFGWGPRENGWSLFAVGAMAVLVQGGLMRMALKRWPADRLAVLGLASAALAYLLWGLATQGWMMYAVIVVDVMGFMVNTSIQSIISNAAGPTEQGRTMGAVSALNSLMAVTAPVIGATLLGTVSHFPKGDWRIGLPFYLSAALAAAAMLMAVRHFKAHPVPHPRDLAAAAAPPVAVAVDAP